MIYRYAIKHLSPAYWSVHVDMLVDPSYANRVIESALKDRDWLLAQEWRGYDRAGWMAAFGVGDTDAHMCFTPRERAKLILRGYWRKISALKVGQSMTVPLVLY